MTYYGFEKVIKKLSKNSLKGIDRIVPIGQALSIEFNWDGYELFNSMTRHKFEIMEDKIIKNFNKNKF